jgi:hypothetical protein
MSSKVLTWLVSLVLVLYLGILAIPAGFALGVLWAVYFIRNGRFRERKSM